MMGGWQNCADGTVGSRARARQGEAPRDDGSAANKLYTGATGEGVSPAARIALKQSLRNIKTAEPPSGARPPSPVVGELPAGER